MDIISHTISEQNSFKSLFSLISSFQMKQRLVIVIVCQILADKCKFLAEYTDTFKIPYHIQRILERKTILI